jgi:hypothetical protein
MRLALSIAAGLAALAATAKLLHIREFDEMVASLRKRPNP